MKNLKQLHEKTRSFHFVFEGIDIYNKKELPDNVDIDLILQKINSSLPKHFLSGIESIQVGEFESLKKRNVDAVYEDGSIYIVPSFVQDQEDLTRNIVHEIAHSVEESDLLGVYGDGTVEQEFLRKRLILLDRLKSLDYNVPSKSLFLQSEYSQEIDNYFYKEIGYPLMAQLTSDMFASPYGCTSLREYFANCFEEYFLGSHSYIKKMSPKVYNKIISLSKKQENSYGIF
jgi:hypothetical protein